MPWEAWATIGVIVLMAVALMRNLAGPDVVLLGGLTLLMTLSLASSRFVSPHDAVTGFGNEGLITIAVLFVVAEGLSQTGAMSLIASPLLGLPRTRVAAQVRLMAPVAGLSAFMNNTPIVAMFMPVVSDWCRKSRISPSKLFIPLSYAAILGGTCTLIGTATNILIMGMVREGEATNATLKNLDIGFFTIGAVGLPAAVVGIGYILLASGKLLPSRHAPVADEEDARRYTVEMHVEAGSPIDGKSIEDAGLRHLPGVYVMGVERGEQRIAPVAPEFVLRGGDLLVLVGIVESVLDMQKIRGLSPATDQVHKLRSDRGDRVLIEAVVSDSCPLLSKSIRAGRFRSMYDAAVIAVHRGGHHLADVKIGDIVLQAGDTLMLEAHPHFIQRERNRRDFFLVSALEGSRPVRHDRAWLALGLLGAMIVAATNPWLQVSLLNAALVAAGLMVVTGCCTGQQARASINWRVLLAMGSALGIGMNLEQSGAAGAIATSLIDALHQLGPVAVLAAVYLLTMLFAESIGHAGAAAIMFPIALSASAIAGAGGTPVDFKPFVIAIMVAASATFATPIGYQTNLMVYGAGGYRFSDYVRFGLPLNLIVMGVVVTLAPIVWPFT